ncbi:MAG: hypothetical protein DMG68_20715, partial [Acidobacteria bacterium]
MYNLECYCNRFSPAHRSIVLSSNSQPASFLAFPAGFLWGISTSGYQVEGGDQDSQWVAWERDGKIRSGDRSGLACDWWGNAEADFDIAKKIGLNALRLSVEWSRLEPRPGEWSLAALHRYREILQALLDRGMQPIVCLHHFTHPAWFEAGGGFLNQHAPAQFEQFVKRAVEGLSDLCRHWVTFNEPNVYTAFGYVLGEFPPGHRGRALAALQATQMMARAHARAYRRIHELQADAEVGWAQHYAVLEAARAHSRMDRLWANTLDRVFNQIFFRAIEDGNLGFPLNL